MSDTEKTRKVSIVANDDLKRASFASNTVHTNKFTILSFIPMFAMSQFTRPANMYFLFCILLEVSFQHQSPIVNNVLYSHFLELIRVKVCCRDIRH